MATPAEPKVRMKLRALAAFVAAFAKEKAKQLPQAYVASNSISNLWRKNDTRNLLATYGGILVFLWLAFLLANHGVILVLPCGIRNVTSMRNSHNTRLYGPEYRCEIFLGLFLACYGIY